MILKMKKNWKFLILCGLSTERFLAIWPFQYKFLINEFLMEKSVYMAENVMDPLQIGFHGTLDCGYQLERHRPIVLENQCGCKACRKRKCCST